MSPRKAPPSALSLATAASALQSTAAEIDDAPRFRALRDTLVEVADWLRALSRERMPPKMSHEERVLHTLLDALRVTVPVRECGDWIDAHSRPIVEVYQPHELDNGLWRLVVHVVDGDELVVSRNDIADMSDPDCEFYRADSVELARFSLDPMRENGISNACEFLDAARRSKTPPQPGEIARVYVD